MTFKIFAKSPAGHGIHSPLVYDFVRSVIYPTESNDQLKEIDWYHSWQMNSPLFIKQSDFGAGSKLENKYLPLGKLIRLSSVSPKLGHLLYRTANWLNAQNILEIGTSVGISTLYLAGARPDAKVVTLEGDTQRAMVARHSFDFLGYKNIKLIEGDFDLTLDSVIESVPKLDLVFFDGYHKAEPTLRYFKRCLESMHSETVFIFDDIRWSNEMFRAWQVIAKHHSVSVSIDLFNVGIVLFRKGIPKQHFKVNFL
jgi:predicted O-methyltransferase YrrM